MMATIAPAMRRETKEEFLDWRKMTGSAIRDRFFGGEMETEAQLVSRYERHNEEVRRVIPKERLLVYNVSEGWGPLCAFLDVRIPSEPFPKTNSTQFFNEHLVPIFSQPAQPSAAT
jgi:hypothetical protein